MENKVCVECLESIKAEASKCPNCQAYQRKWERFTRSQLGSFIIAMVFLVPFYFWLTDSIIEEDSIYIRFINQNSLNISPSGYMLRYAEPPRPIGLCTQNNTRIVFKLKSTTSDRRIQRFPVAVLTLLNGSAR